jgi:predicted regulator of Ras-like GTPase activity (Roadblock/LC7/MglB family)
MPTIRDLVSVLRRRDGVDAAVVLGRDGLLIEGATQAPFDPEGLAALVPPLALSALDLGRASERGDFGLMVLEYDGGSIIVTALSAEAFLFVLLRPTANLASLLYELRRHRAQIAALV